MEDECVMKSSYHGGEDVLVEGWCHPQLVRLRDTTKEEEQTDVTQEVHILKKERKEERNKEITQTLCKETEGRRERKKKERKGKERKGKERKGNERKGKERKEEEEEITVRNTSRCLLKSRNHQLGSLRGWCFTLTFCVCVLLLQ